MARNGFFAVFRREFRRIFFTRDLLLLCFGAPLLYGVVLSSIYYHKCVDQIPVGVVDNDHTRLSRMVARYAGATQNIRIVRHYQSAGEAVGDMMRGTITGMIYLPAGLSSDIKRGQDATALLSIDSSNFLSANPVMQSLLEATGTISAGIFASSAEKRSVTRERALSLAQPLILDPRILFNPHLHYSIFMLPGLLYAILQQIILVSLGYTLAEERENNRLGELHELSGRSPAKLLAGKTLPYVIVNYCMGVFFLLVLLPVFDIRVYQQLPAVLVALFAFVLAVTAFGVMISAFFHSVAMALMVLMFYSMPTFLISGFSWPLAAMPWSVRLISYVFPSTFFFVDFRMLVIGAAPFRCVVPSLLVLLGFSAVCGAAAWLALRRSVRKQAAG